MHGAILCSLPLLRAIECQELLTNAVKVAVNNKQILCKMLKDKVRVSESELETYLNMYANNDSIVLNETQIRALNRLFELGFKAGIYKDLIIIEDYLLPLEYKVLRFGSDKD